MLKIVKAFKMQ